MFVASCAPQVPVKYVPHKNTTPKRIQKLKKIWKLQKQMKKDEKELFRELLERPIQYDLDFDDLFDTF